MNHWQSKAVVLLPALLGLAATPKAPGTAGHAATATSTTTAAEEAIGAPYQVGIASWYGADFHGKETTDGEHFNMFALTAAHPNLPFGTRVRVTNLLNGRSVILRVNDRGPVCAGRVIDLSRAGARAIGFYEDGLIPVRLDLVGGGRLR